MARKAWRAWILSGASAFIFGCATPAHQRLDRLTTGMDKAEVLDTAGNPKRTQRLNDGDLWTFVYYVGDRHFEREIRFENGHVVVISEAKEVKTAGPDPVIQDYESLVHEAKSRPTPPKSKSP